MEGTNSEVVAADVPKAIVLFSNIEKDAGGLRASVESLCMRFQDNEINTNKGNSLLELKNMETLDYMTNLLYLQLRKLSGMKLENCPAVERLVEKRAVLERIRPLEEKIKFQIDRQLKAASFTDGKSGGQNLKAKLDDIVSDSDDEESEGDEKSKKEEKEEKKLYEIPRISQTHYNEGETDKASAAKEREKRRVLNSATMRDYLYEHTDDPEVRYNTDTLRAKAAQKRRDIERYEEENMLRLTLTKRDKASLNQTTTLGTMKGDMLGFMSTDALEGRSGAESGQPPYKKKKKMGGKKGSKRFRKKK